MNGTERINTGARRIQSSEAKKHSSRSLRNAQSSQ